MGPYILLNCNTLNATNSHLIDTSSFSVLLLYGKWGRLPTCFHRNGLGDGGEAPAAEGPALTQPRRLAEAPAASRHHGHAKPSQFVPEIRSCRPITGLRAAGYLCYPRRFWWNTERAPLLAQRQHPGMPGFILPPRGAPQNPRHPRG